MLKHYLTKDVFQAGIEVYLRNHSYGTAQSDDLWDSMNEVSILEALFFFSFFFLNFSEEYHRFYLFPCWLKR